MSERGVFAVDRGIWDHPELDSDEPFSRREAWIWLISEAAWKPCRVRVGEVRVNLRRGQLAHSIRFMADKWRWSKSAVARFLDILKTGTMIGTESGTGVTVITICNYDEYQRVSLPDRDTSGTATGTAAGQQRDREEDTKYIKLDVDDDRGRRQKAFEVSAAIAKVAGYPTPDDWPPGWMGSPMRVEVMLERGWRPDIMLAAAREVMAKKRDGPPGTIGYFERAFAAAHARQSAPLPSVDAGEFGKVIPYEQHVAGRVPARGSRDDTRVRAAAVLDRLAEIASADEPEAGGGNGSGIVERISKFQSD